MALIRTDYGLIYNTDGSLCATLLPEGGVAVTEGTENLFNIDNVRENYTYVPTEIISDYHVIAYYDNPSGGAGNWAWSSGWFYIIYNAPFSQGDYSFSFDAKILEQGNYSTVLKLRLVNGDGVILKDLGTIELSQEFKHFIVQFNVDVENANALQIALNSNSVEFKNIQLEPKPYSTPFTEGTRPAGILPYHDLAKQFNQREFTFVAEWRPYSELGTGPSDTGNERFFHIDTGNNTQGNRYMLARIYNTQQLRFSVPRADGATEQHFSFQPSIYEANQWYLIAVVLDVENMKCRIHLNDEYQEFTLSGTPAMLDLQRFFLGCVGTGGQLNGELKNVQIINEALPIEVINNF